MKKVFLYIAGLLVTVALSVSCTREPALPLPVALSENGGVWATTSSGAVTLHWNAITDPDLYYVEVRYTVEGKEYVKTASQYSTELTIDGLLKRYGAIDFEIQPFNRDGAGASEKLKVSAQAGAAPKKIVLSGKSQKVALSEQMVWGDDPQQGTSYANLWDNNPQTVYHSQWNPDPTPMPHYLVVDLGKECYAFAFGYVNRDSEDRTNFVSSMNIYGSTTFDGTNFSTASCMLIDSVDSGLPDGRLTEYDSKSYISTTDPIRYVWFEVLSTYGESNFFTFAELTLRQLMTSVYDPETGQTTPAEEPIPTGEHLFKKLTIENIYTNAQESSEGHVSNFVDGNPATFFHTSWSEEIAFPHYVVVDLGEKVEEFTFQTIGRAGTSTAQWKDLNIYVSSDYDTEEFFGVEATSGAEFKDKVAQKATLLKQYTGLPFTAAPAVVSYDTLSCPTPIRYVWFETTATTNDGSFMAFGELMMYKGYYGEPDPEYTFTINPTPVDATVVINDEERNSVKLTTGSKITWSVSAVGYKDQSGSLTLTSNTTLDVVLEAESASYVKIDLTADQLFTNAQEPQEGPIANLIDGRIASDSYFHTAWSSEIPFPHYIVIKLGESISGMKFQYANRVKGVKDSDINVKEMNVYVGMDSFDGSNYVVDGLKSLVEYTELPDQVGVADKWTFKSDELKSDTPFNTVYLQINNTWTVPDGYFCFSWSELELYKAVLGGSSIDDIPYTEKGEE